MAKDGMNYDGLSHQGSIDDFLLEDDFFNPNPILSEMYSTLSPTCIIENNAQKALISPPSSSSSSSCSEVLISFSTPTKRDVEKSYFDPLTNHFEESTENNNIYKKNSVEAGDHAILERKRRQKLTQLFISLSKILPGLKKMDKASLLGDTIQYMKELQQRVKFLEKEIKNNPSKRSLAAKVPSDVSLSQGSDYSSNEEDIVPEINVRVFDKSALINIYCNKQNGVVGRIVSEMEKLHLSVRDMNIMSFCRTSLDISIVSEMENGFDVNVEDIVKAFQSKLSGEVHCLRL
ncbi:PREDICTED: transcription factor bHLH25-like [Nicotiana attenuata]|uniref:Transcription factor bhlh25 n=1 Tax=Nicotiana attenuata TaxID=49451 RepID=A0A1J6JBH1_NICAT|nr:PREDICTED: transcription factor bHLH25-like [Nicotiana attenuata]OIT04505.1 transcription factor bhlh25 [Nicotiana attenuata]